MSETRTYLGDFGHLMRMVSAAEDFGLARTEACAVTQQVLERQGSVSESLDGVAAALATRVLEKVRAGC